MHMHVWRIYLMRWLICEFVHSEKLGGILTLSNIKLWCCESKCKYWHLNLEVKGYLQLLFTIQIRENILQIAKLYLLSRRLSCCSWSCRSWRCASRRRRCCCCSILWWQGCRRDWAGLGRGLRCSSSAPSSRRRLNPHGSEFYFQLYIIHVVVTCGKTDFFSVPVSFTSLGSNKALRNLCILFFSFFLEISV